MTDYGKVVIDTLERIPASALIVSGPLIIIGGVITIAVKIGFIREQAYSGYVADAGPLMLTLGVGVLLLGILRAIYSLPGLLYRAIQARKDNQSNQQKLLENLRVMPLSCRLICLFILEQPSGRMPYNPKSRIFKILWDFEILRNDDGDSWNMAPSTMVKINPSLYSAVGLAPELRKDLSSSFQIDLSNPKLYGDLIRRQLGKDYNGDEFE